MSKLRGYLRWMRAESARWDELQRLRARFPDATIDDGVHIVSPDRLHLEPGAIVQAGTHIHCGGAAWTRGEGHVRLGRETVISPHCILWGGGGIDIEGGVNVGPGAMIFSTQELFEVVDDDPTIAHKLAPVTVGQESRIGAQAIIAPGGSMGPACVLGAHSLLLSHVPEGKLYGGMPAKELRDLRTFRHTLS